MEIETKPPLPFEVLEWPMPRKLTKEEHRFLKATLQGPESDIIATANKYSVTRADLQDLAASEKLNDNIMNYYLSMAVVRLRELDRNVQVVDSMIATLFREDGNVRTWNNDVDPFEYDMLGIPMHCPDHWVGIGINVVKHEIHVGDSMGHKYPRQTKILKKWLKEMYLRHYNYEDEQKWKVGYPKAPRQNSDVDCGVFAMLFCISFMMGKQCYSLYHQRDIPSYRRLFALHILSTGIVNGQARGTLIVPLSLYIAIRTVLEVTPGKTALEIYRKIVELRLYNFKSADADSQRGSVRQTLKRSVCAKKIIGVGRSYVRHYYLNNYSALMAQELEAKHPKRILYDVPDDAATYSSNNTIFSLLHRYTELTHNHLRSLAQSEKYISKIPSRSFYQTRLKNLKETGRIYSTESAAGKQLLWHLKPGTLPPVNLTIQQRESGAVEKKLNDKKFIVVPTDVQDNFIRVKNSQLDGRGSFARQYLGHGMLFEITHEKIILSESGTRDPFMFCVDTGDDKMMINTEIEGNVPSPAAFANDAGPTSSQLVPMLMVSSTVPPTFKIYWRLNRPVNAGQEIFCAYNSGPRFARAHWSFDYPANWTKPDSVNPNDLHVERLFARLRRPFKMLPPSQNVNKKRKDAEESIVAQPMEKKRKKRKAKKQKPEPEQQQGEDDDIETEHRSKLVVTRQSIIW